MIIKIDKEKMEIINKLSEATEENIPPEQIFDIALTRGLVKMCQDAILQCAQRDLLTDK